MPTIRINSTNYSGVTCNISFTGCTGNTDTITGVTLPYDYTTSNYEGSYSVYFPVYDKTCPLDITCASPTPSVSVTPTPTPSAPSIDPDYQAILNEATLQGYTLPSSSGQTLQNQLVLDLKSAGIWSELDLFYVMATDGDGNYSLLNWINPTSYSGITVVSPTFVSNQGWDRVCGDYIRTQYTPDVHAVNSTLDDTSMFVWDLDNTSCSRDTYWGTLGSSSQNRFNSQVTPDTNYCVNGVCATYTIDTTGIGFKMIQRTTGGTLNYLINSGTAAESISITPGSGSLGNVELNMGRNGTGNGNRSNMMISIGGRGASLEGKESDLYNALNTYISSL